MNQATRETSIASDAQSEGLADRAVTPHRGAGMRRFLPAALAVTAYSALAGASYWHISRPEYRYQIALDALAVGDVDQLRHEARALAGQPDYEPHARLLEAAYLIKTYRPGNAIEALKQAAQAPEIRPLALTLAGESCLQAGLYAQAETFLRGALTLDVRQAEAHRLFATLLYDIGDDARALGEMHRSAELAPHDPRPHRLTGHIWFAGFHKWELAVAANQESLRRGPWQADRYKILLEIAESEVKRQHYAEALDTLQIFSRALVELSQDPAARRALMELTKAPLTDADIADASAQALALRAECYVVEGRRADALKVLENALQIAPNNLASLSLRARIALERRQSRAAIDVLLHAVEAHPMDYPLREMLKQAYQQIEDEQRAKEQFEIGQQIYDKLQNFELLRQKANARPQDADIRYEMGMLARELRLSKNAPQCFRAALFVNPSHEKAKQALRE